MMEDERYDEGKAGEQQAAADGIELSKVGSNGGQQRHHHDVISGYNPLENRDRSDSDAVLFLGTDYVRSSEIIVATEIDTTVPNIWTFSHIGLYSQYAAVGLLYGSAGTLLPFCVYVFDGPANVCSNSGSIFLFPWSFKLLFAIITDCYHPFGMRRKFWMLLGWTFVLIVLFLLAVFVQHLSAFTWLLLQLMMQAFMMFSDVPADGYSVQLGKLESPEQRGQVLATGQRIRFCFSLLAGVIQTFLLNGRATNKANCPISFDECWSWGLSIQGYYGLLFAIVAVLVIPICWLKEIPSKHPVPNFRQFLMQIWDTLQNQTTLYLIIYALGIGALTNFPSIVSVYMQFYIITLTNFQAGMDTLTSYAALVFAVWIFQRFLIRKNWRITHYLSSIFANLLGLLWLLPFFNVGKTRNPWFTIFIDLDQSFINGLSQVLYSMAVIEISSAGQEATTYELVITVNNAAIALSGVFATQLLAPMKSIGCTNSLPPPPPSTNSTVTTTINPINDTWTSSSCPNNQVDITSVYGFDHTNGPTRFTQYTLVLTTISIVCCLIFTPFLPRDKDQCQEWKAAGEARGRSKIIGICTVILALITIIYGFTAAILLLNPSTSCSAFVGGSGCSK